MTRAAPATKSNPFRPSLSWLLVFVPAVLALEFTHSKSHVAIFICSCLAILPLAGWLGKATEHLAERTSEGVGGLLNATFGNAAELIIAIVAAALRLRGSLNAVMPLLMASTPVSAVQPLEKACRIKNRPRLEAV